MQQPMFNPPVDYDETVSEIDELICGLVKERKVLSNDKPGVPPFEYIAEWSQKYGIYEDLLKTLFLSMYNEKFMQQMYEPGTYQKIVPVMKTVESDGRLVTVVSILQYDNASLVNVTMEPIRVTDFTEQLSGWSLYELSIGGGYACQSNGGGCAFTHFACGFVVTPPLPDDVSGLTFTLEEYGFQANVKKKVGPDIVIPL